MKKYFLKVIFSFLKKIYIESLADEDLKSSKNKVFKFPYLEET